MLTSCHSEIVVLERYIGNAYAVGSEVVVDKKLYNSFYLVKPVADADDIVLIDGNIAEARVLDYFHGGEVVAGVDSDIFAAALVELLGCELVDELALVDDPVGIGKF